MTISSWPRLVIGTLVLIIGAATGLMAWSVETCAGGQAGSLWLGGVALVGNVIAWGLLGSRVPSKPVLFVAVLPALAAVSYTISTVQLAKGYLIDGLNVCTIMKAGQQFPPDGREALFVILWLVVCTSFWAGLAPVVARAIRVHGGSSESE